MLHKLSAKQSQINLVDEIPQAVKISNGISFRYLIDLI